MKSVVCPSVCLSVCLSQAGTAPKQLNAGSRKQHDSPGRDSSFLTPNISAKFQRDHPQGGAK